MSGEMRRPPFFFFFLGDKVLRLEGGAIEKMGESEGSLKGCWGWETDPGVAVIYGRGMQIFF